MRGWPPGTTGCIETMSVSIVADCWGGSASVFCQVAPPSREKNTTASPNVSLPELALTALRLVTTQRRSSGPTVTRGSVTRFDVPGKSTLVHVGGPVVAAVAAPGTTAEARAVISSVRRAVLDMRGNLLRDPRRRAGPARLRCG